MQIETRDQMRGGRMVLYRSVCIADNSGGDSYAISSAADCDAAFKDKVKLTEGVFTLVGLAPGTNSSAMNAVIEIDFAHSN